MDNANFAEAWHGSKATKKFTILQEGFSNEDHLHLFGSFTE